MLPAEVANELRALAKEQTPEVALDVLKRTVLPYIESIRGARKLKRQSGSKEGRKNKKQRVHTECEDETIAGANTQIFEEVEVPWLNAEIPIPEISRTIIAEDDDNCCHPLYSILGDYDASDRKWFVERVRQLFREPDTLKRGSGHIAAYWGNTAMLKFLLMPLGDRQALWDIHQAAQGGWKAIHFASSRGHLDCVDLCIKAGSKVNVATLRGQKTPLKLAKDNGHQLVADFLEKKGGRVREEAAAFDDMWNKMKAQMSQAGVKASSKVVTQSHEGAQDT